MNDFRLWAHTFSYYEQIRIVVDMKDSRSWTHGSRLYAQLKVVNDMKDFGIWKTLGYERLWVMSLGL